MEDKHFLLLKIPTYPGIKIDHIPHYIKYIMLKVLYMAMVGLRVGGDPTELYTPLPGGTLMDQSFPAVSMSLGISIL